MSVGHFDLQVPRGTGFGFGSGNPRTNHDTLFGNASSCTDFVQKRLIPGLPDYSKIEVRMGSFIEKQQYFQQSVIDMAVAGFYYLGEPTPDAVKCPWCNSVCMVIGKKMIYHFLNIINFLKAVLLCKIRLKK